MISFYLVRHGEKEAIPFDPPLTALGTKQAQATAQYLKGIEFKEIIASPKSRAKQTAEIIAKLHSLPVNTDERLVERMEWEKDESLDEFIAEWNKTDINRSYSPRKGISSSNNGERVKGFLEEIAEKHKDGNILVVTHGGTIGDLLRNLFIEGVIEHKIEPLTGARYVEILECAITRIRKNKNKYELLAIGDVSHLLTPSI